MQSSSARHSFGAYHTDLDDLAAAGARKREPDRPVHRPLGDGSDHAIDIVKAPVDGIQPLFDLIRILAAVFAGFRVLF
jgi:hypothetical protein